MPLQPLIIKKDLAALEEALVLNPALANEGLPYDERNPARAHPLHRICDGVFNRTYSDEEAVSIAKVLLDHGASVDGYGLAENQDTPLIAAASLHAEHVGILYIDKGATVNHRGVNGATALHWAAWTGRDKLVHRLLEAGADVHKPCATFRGTPLLWAVHGYQFGGPVNRYRQIACVRQLLAAGANKLAPNKEGATPVDLLGDQDSDMRQALS